CFCSPDAAIYSGPTLHAVKVRPETGGSTLKQETNLRGGLSLRRTVCLLLLMPLLGLGPLAASGCGKGSEAKKDGDSKKGGEKITAKAFAEELKGEPIMGPGNPTLLKPADKKELEGTIKVGIM